MNNPYDGFEDHVLNDGRHFFVGQLPEEQRPDADEFEALWTLCPEKYDERMIHGRRIPLPRWQQAYGVDYHFSGQTSVALPIPPVLEPFRDWSSRAIDPRLNGLLLNWYDGALGHYLGPHHDSTVNMVEGAPIVTISLGEERVFRLMHPERKLTSNFTARDGTVFVMPYETNSAWKHAVPKSTRYRGRRISITLRGLYS